MLAGDCEQYRNVQVHTASGVSLIIMVLDGILKHLNLAQAALKAGQMEDASKSISKIYDLLGELSGSLNFEAGDIATRLFSLYEYCGRRMAEALFHKDPAMLETVRSIVLTLREAWVECSRRGFKNSPRARNGFQVMVG